MKVCGPMPGISFLFFSGSAWLMTLLWLNFGLMVNRIVQRVIFVTGYYGLTQGAAICPASFLGAT